MYLRCWAAVCAVEMRNTYKILIGKPEKKNPFARFGGIFKTDLTKKLFKGVESINVAQTAIGLRRGEN
jgi:hypothetical protein